jgi:hypothetical protein
MEFIYVLHYTFFTKKYELLETMKLMANYN